MPIRGSPNGANHLRPQAGRDRLEQVVAINRNAWSQSIGTAGRNRPVRALWQSTSAWARMSILNLCQHGPVLIRPDHHRIGS
jgi:hypothetical protein